MDSVSDFGYHMFYNCEKLQHLEITPTAVPAMLRVDENIFYNCVNLKEIIFKGTKEQAIQLKIGNRSKKGWRKGSSIKKIISTDGVIKLSQLTNAYLPIEITPSGIFILTKFLQS